MLTARNKRKSYRLAIVLALTLTIVTGGLPFTDIAIRIASAATFTVTNTNNSGAGSLRQAVLDSNAAPGSDTITFDPSVFSTPRTVTLASVITISPAAGDTLTITGPGANLLTISGNNVTGIFTVNTGATVSISGIRLTQAGVSAISNSGNLTVTNCIFDSNNTTTDGAAIFNSLSLTVTGCAFTNNTGANIRGGGAIHNSLTAATATITNSTFTGNRHTATNGGAIGNRAGTMTITDSTFSNNSTPTGNGGAIQNEGTMSISGSTFTGNTATQVNASNGGAISNQNNGQLTIANTLITGNSATVHSGGIYHQPTGTLALIITNSTISNNIANSDSNASGEGGGLYLSSATNAPVNISGSTINGNQANGGGGTTTSGNGGGIYFSSAGTLTNSTISGNTAGRNGGGIFTLVGGGGSKTIDSLTIVNNTAAMDGGGIHQVSTGNVFNSRNTIVANNTDDGSGPDIFGTVVSQGYNLIRTTTGATITGTTTGNITGQDPVLGPLQNNGGLTFTHALLPGSPAIDKGNSFGLTTDQRGSPRPFDDPAIPNGPGGDGSDIGAFEMQPIDPIRVVLSRDGSGQLVATITITNPLPDPVPGVQLILVRASTLDGSAFVDGVPVPQAFGTVNPGQSVTTVVTFPGTASVPSGFSGLVRVDLGYTGGTYSETEQVVTP